MFARVFLSAACGMLGCTTTHVLPGTSAPPPAESSPSAPAAPPAPGAQEGAEQEAPKETPRQRMAAPRHPDAGSLLDAVERRTRDLKEFTAGLLLQTTDSITDDTERRNGQVVFIQEPGKPETRQFAVVFTNFIDSSGRVDERPVRYLYADGWLTEADFTQRTLLRRQLARPGEPYDPLKPGEGPVPLPVGQRKEDVLKRFEVSIAEVPTHPALARLTDVQGVAMTPRPGMADRDLVSAIVWYDLRTMAPVGVEAQRRNGSTVVVLRNPVINGGLTDEQRALLTLAAGQTEGWKVDERPLAADTP